MGTERQAHWEAVYTTRDTQQVSWYAPRLQRSLDWIVAHADPAASVIDVGGGAATLVDDLLDLGFDAVTVLDIAGAALKVAQDRLGDRAERASWVVADVTEADLGKDRFDLWHDRTVFHFLTAEADREAYVALAARAVKPGGTLIIAGFSPNGPTKCSNLPIQQHTPQSLAQALGASFELVESTLDVHPTPRGGTQEMVYARFKRVNG